MPSLPTLQKDYPFLPSKPWAGGLDQILKRVWREVWDGSFVSHVGFNTTACYTAAVAYACKKPASDALSRSTELRAVSTSNVVVICDNAGQPSGSCVTLYALPSDFTTYCLTDATFSWSLCCQSWTAPSSNVAGAKAPTMTACACHIAAIMTLSHTYTQLLPMHKHTQQKTVGRLSTCAHWGGKKGRERRG